MQGRNHCAFPGIAARIPGSELACDAAHLGRRLCPAYARFEPAEAAQRACLPIVRLRRRPDQRGIDLRIGGPERWKVEALGQNSDDGVSRAIQRDFASYDCTVAAEAPLPN